jgi:hypothetical protein
VYHVQFRQFPNLARAFNLSREELHARILVPWAAGESVQWADRRWSPERAKLTVYEGPALRPEEIGMGRGWANATRSGEDVTERLLAESERPGAREQALAALRDEIVSRAGAGSMQVREVVGVAGELHPDWRASDRLALAEQAIWELLHLGSLRIVRICVAGSAIVEREQWQPLLFDWATWTGDEAPTLILKLSE